MKRQLLPVILSRKHIMNKNQAKIILTTILILSFLFTIPIIVFKWYYPYGMRSATLPMILLSLRAYADDHGVFYPKGGNTSFESLQKLYPKYCANNPIWAGLSGDIDTTLKTLKNGGELDAKKSSWVYFPGFNVNDDSYDYEEGKEEYAGIALIWDRQDGITFNGSRVQSGSHAVGFVDGVWRQIPREEWKDFVERQKILRKKILSKERDQGSGIRD